MRQENEFVRKDHLGNKVKYLIERCRIFYYSLRKKAVTKNSINFITFFIRMLLSIHSTWKISTARKTNGRKKALNAYVIRYNFAMSWGFLRGPIIGVKFAESNRITPQSNLSHWFLAYCWYKMLNRNGKCTDVDV